MKNIIGGAILCLAIAALIGCGRNPESGSLPPGTPVPSLKPSHTLYSLQWVTNDVPANISPGASVPVHINVKNTGDWAWPDPVTANPSHPNGSYAVRLAHNWANEDGNLPLPDAVRGDIAAPVPPGQIANFTIQVTAPQQPGRYQLRIDLVEELVTFFSAKGTEKLIVPVTVQ